MFIKMNINVNKFLPCGHIGHKEILHLHVLI